MYTHYYQCECGSEWESRSHSCVSQEPCECGRLCWPVRSEDSETDNGDCDDEAD